MVSRRTFITISTIMLVLLFMFQAPEVVKEQMNHYEENEYAQGASSGFTSDDTFSVKYTKNVTQGRYIVYIGDPSDGGVGSMVKQWCQYSKRYMKAYVSIRQFKPLKLHLPEAVLIDSAYLNEDRETGTLMKLVEEWGINLIFCNLPDLQQLKTNMKLRRLVGIRAVLFEKIQVKGIHLFDDFLLGGEKIYKLDDTMEDTQQDLQIQMPWCQTASGTKVYMVGMMDEDTINEELPAVVWRNSIGRSKIFVVNGDYMSNNGAAGFLEAMMYELNPYALYPVVNAQNLVLLNYPTVADENEQTMMELYSQPLQAVYRDIVWPGLAATAERSGKKMTCMLAPQQDYEDGIEPDEHMLIYYMKLLQEEKGEAGISAAARNLMESGDKLSADEMFLNGVLPEYEFMSFYESVMTEKETKQALEHSLLKNVKTVLTDYNPHKPLLSYQTDDVTRQMVTNDGYSHTFSEDVRMHSIQTAFAYSTIAVDLNKIAYPQKEEDSWEQLYEPFVSNTTTYWKPYKVLDATTLAESDVRIRRYLALDYTQERTDDTIDLTIENFEEEAFFILRLRGEYIKEAKGAQFEMFQDDVYLIRAQQEQVSITLGGGGINRDKMIH